MPLVTLDFNAVTYWVNGPAWGPFKYTHSTISEDGFLVDNPLTSGVYEFGNILMNTDGFFHHGPGTPMATYQNGYSGQSKVRIVRNDPESWDLVSLKMDTRESDPYNKSVTITATRADGVTQVQAVFVLDEVNSLETLVLPPTFRDLIEVIVDGPINFQFDDVVLRTYIMGTNGADSFAVPDAAEADYKLLDGDDRLDFGTFFSADDIADGGWGFDTFRLSGNHALSLGSGAVQNITNFECMELSSGTYELVFDDAFVAAGLQFIVDGSALGPSETLSFDASQETDGAFTVFGGEGADRLTSGAGYDFLYGGRGDDTLIGGWAGDVLDGGAGDDTASYADSPGAVRVDLARGQGFGGEAQGDTYSDIENLIGTLFGDVLGGDGNANRLDGGGGRDRLDGKGGSDDFAFTTALGAGNVDTIRDMVSGVDRILLDDAVFAKLPLGPLARGAFQVGARALDADDRIIYDSSTGTLFFDADGSNPGAAVAFAVLTGTPSITAADFLVI